MHKFEQSAATAIVPDIYLTSSLLFIIAAMTPDELYQLGTDLHGSPINPRWPVLLSAIEHFKSVSDFSEATQ